MATNILPLPPGDQIKAHILKALDPYWDNQPGLIEQLPVKKLDNFSIQLPLTLVEVELPEWAVNSGIDGKILLPSEICRHSSCNWENVDWWLGAFLLLEAWHEREFEEENGSIHSYSFRLKEWDSRAWDHAWVNRIGMFLRAWAVHRNGIEETKSFSDLREAEILMTHDVDAVAKTLPIRLKQCAFNIYKAAGTIKQGKYRSFLPCMGKAFTFLAGNEDWWKLDAVIQLEQKAGIRSWFNFYADDRSKTIKRWLFDPGYNVSCNRIIQFINTSISNGWSIGLHPGFDSWNDQAIIAAQKERLNVTTGQSVSGCRQHWLRFGWGKTWSAQVQAGLELDTTLMFNDRPGFRASAALNWHPWNTGKMTTYKLTELPTILMDSHFYDYQEMDEITRPLSLKKYIDEVRLVNGKAAVLWHPHTLSEDYGWKSGFEELLELIKDIGHSFQ